MEFNNAHKSSIPSFLEMPVPAEDHTAYECDLSIPEITDDDLSSASFKDKRRSRRSRKAYHSQQNKYHKMSVEDEEVYEFGFLIDLKDQKSVTRYLIAYSNWLDDLTLPTDHARFLVWARNHVHKKPHRVVALTMLVPYMPKARALSLAHAGKLSEKRFIALTAAEAQSLELIAILAITLAAGFMYIMTRQTQLLITTVSNQITLVSSTMSTQMNNVGGQVAQSVQALSTQMTNVGGQVTQSVQNVNNITAPIGNFHNREF
jgi:ethanolamine utilization protein EutQ (cupin superfamily)